MALVDYNDEIRGRVIANSEGLYLRDELPQMFFIVQALSEENGRRHLSRERLGMHMGFEMFEQYPPEEVAKRAAREAVAMLGAKEAPAGIMDVVMQNGWGGVLVHEAVGHPWKPTILPKKWGLLPGNWDKKWPAMYLPWWTTEPCPICVEPLTSMTRAPRCSVMC